MAAVAGGPGHVRDARRPAVRHPARPADRSDAASGRAVTPRSRSGSPIAVDVLAALADADGDPALADALDRWELSLFQSEPFRSEQLRAALVSLLGETWPMRCCVLLAEDASARARSCTASSPGSTPVTPRRPRRSMPPAGRSSPFSARATAIELAHDLDRELLGLGRRRPRAPSPSDAFGSNPLPARERAGATVEGWKSRERCSTDSSASSARSSAVRRLAASSLASFAGSARRSRGVVATGGGRGAGSTCAEDRRRRFVAPLTGLRLVRTPGGERDMIGR